MKILHADVSDAEKILELQKLACESEAERYNDYTIAPLGQTLPERRGLKVEQFGHRVNISSPQSDLRIQIQTDPRYQEFIPRAALKNVLGYKMFVASLEDVLRGKVWAYADQTRRRSKRQKDLADILRIIEVYPQLKENLPLSLQEELEKD